MNLTDNKIISKINEKLNQRKEQREYLEKKQNNKAILSYYNMKELENNKIFYIKYDIDLNQIDNFKYTKENSLIDFTYRPASSEIDELECYQKLTKQPVTIKDLSAAVTGLLLALNLPAADYKDIWWPCIVGSLIAIIVVKGLFGGIGKNFANPAITARVILLVAFGVVGKQVFPVMSEIVSGATPLSVLKNSDAGQLPSLFEMFICKRGGAIG